MGNHAKKLGAASGESEYARGSKEQPGKPKRKLSQRGAATELKFIAAANDAFLANGFAGSKIAQIVEMGNLSVGSFYHLFEDKKDLLDRAAEVLMADFHERFEKIDLGKAQNGNLYTMLYNLALEGRSLVARHHGIYRALLEQSQNHFSGLGPVQAIAPTVLSAVLDVLPEYVSELPVFPEPETTGHMVQVIAMSVLQAELGMAPLFPTDKQQFADVIARAAYGVLTITPPSNLYQDEVDT